MKLFWKFLIGIECAIMVGIFIAALFLTGCTKVEFGAYLKQQQESAALSGFLNGYAKGLAEGVKEGWEKGIQDGGSNCNDVPDSESLFSSTNTVKNL